MPTFRAIRMKKHWWIIGGMVVATGLLFVGRLLYCHLVPVPSEIVGVWENSEKLIDAGPGEVRFVISDKGVIDVRYDRTKYFWWDEQMYISVCGEDFKFWFDPEHKVSGRIQLQGDEMTLTFSKRNVPDWVVKLRRVREK